MLVVKIELWPGGNKKKARVIGEINIANDGTGSDEEGNYDCALSYSGKDFGRRGIWNVGRVEKHDRSLTPYHLLLKCLQSALSKDKGNEASQPEQSWDQEEELSPLGIVSPPDWDEYDFFLRAGGALEYEHWKSVKKGIHQAALGCTQSLGSFAEYADIDVDAEE